MTPARQKFRDGKQYPCRRKTRSTLGSPSAKQSNTTSLQVSPQATPSSFNRTSVELKHNIHVRDRRSPSESFSEVVGKNRKGW